MLDLTKVLAGLFACHQLANSAGMR